MGKNMEEESKSIDVAVSGCEDLIKGHTEAANKIIRIITAITALLIAILGSDLFAKIIGKVEGVKLDVTYYYPFLGIYVLVFSVLMSIYRFHLNQGAKAEHQKIGFMRIRIAANNSSDGFDSEVRQSLTEGAFDNPIESKGLFSKSEKIENPLQGHPTSDVSVAILNKILDKIDIGVTKKDK